MKIEIIGLEKKYGDKVVFKDLNLSMEYGKITCIMGRSGCGKTTLLNILLNLIKADEGQIRGLEGKLFSAIFQENRLCENFSVINNITLAMKKPFNEGSIIRDLKEVGLGEEVEKRVSTLSGGMKRRVAIVRAIRAKSDVIIMDEPFKGLDEKTRNQVIEYIKRNTKEKTVIITTHNIEEVKLLEANLIEMKA